MRVSQDSAASDRDSGVGEQDMDGAKAIADDKATDDKVCESVLKSWFSLTELKVKRSVRTSQGT